MNRRWLLSLFLLLALALLKKRLGRRDPPVATPVTRARPRAAVSSAVSSFDYGLLLQSKKLPSGLVVRIAWQGIAGVVLELLQYLSWRVGSLGAPEIDEDLFAQLPAILGVSERGGPVHVAGARVRASVCGNGDALHEHSAARLRDQGHPRSRKG
jgi:hypothetical protein